MRFRFIISIMLVLLMSTPILFAGGAQEGGKPTVTVFWALYDGLTDEYRRDLEAAFEAEYPDVDLDIVPVPWDQLQDRLTTSIAGGDPPELSVIGTRWLLEFASLDAIEPITNWISQDTIDNILPGTIEATLGGELMGLPIAAGARLLVINKQLTQVVPRTMEELRQASIQATGGNRYGLIMPGKKHTELTDFAYYFYAAGGEFFETLSDGSYGRSVVNSPAGVKALQFMVDLAENDRVVPEGYLSQNRNEAHPVFYSGDAAYVMIGAWVESAMEQADANFEVEFAQIPGFEGQASAPLIITDTLALFSEAENKAEAGLFVDFFYRDEWKTGFDELVGFPPVTKSGSRLPQFQSPLYQALSEAANNAKPWPLIEGWAESSDYIWDAVSEALLGSKSPSDALNDAASKIDRLRR